MREMLQRQLEQIFFLKIKMENSYTYSRLLFRWNNKKNSIEIAKSKNIKVHERKIKSMKN
jgi:hypothetical protein